MKTYLQKIALYSFLLLFLGAIWNEVNTQPKFYNAYLFKKIEYVSKHPENFNTLFLGSSKINNQINPFVVDSVNKNLHSYNLGANASFLLENLSTLEYIIEQNKIHSKTIVLEVQNHTNLSRTNLKTERSFKVFNWSNLLFSVRYNWVEKNYSQIAYSFFSYFLNCLRLDKSLPSLELGSFSDSIIQVEKGYLPLDNDFNTQVILRHKDLLKNPKVITQRENAFLKDVNTYTSNKFYTEKIQDLRKRAAKNNLKIVLLLMAPAEPDAKKAEALIAPLNPYINVINPIKYPEFYTLQNRWDYGHLNAKGAKKVSKIVAEELSNLKK